MGRLNLSIDRHLPSVLNPCRYGKQTHGIFEKLGIPGPRPKMYVGTVGKYSNVRVLVISTLITLSARIVTDSCAPTVKQIGVVY